MTYTEGGLGVVSLVLLLLSACQPHSAILPAAMTLEGQGISGVIVPHPAVGCQPAGVRVGLWGPTWTTGAPVEAHLSSEVDAAVGGAEVLWLEFPVQTGLGETVLALRLQGEEVRLPLGARPDEFALRLQHTPDLLADAEQAAAQARAEAGVQREQAAWARGEFLLRDGAETVGEVRFQGDAGPPMVSVHDLSWLTPSPVAARRRDDGGDLLLQFPVEPSLQGEDGLLRVNLLTRAVVVPSGPTPAPGVDRRLGLVPGRLSEEARAAAVQSAVAASDVREAEWLRAQAPALAEAAARAGGSGGCGSLEAIGEPWGELMAGYILDIQPQEGGGCGVQIAPEVVQHRRRFVGSLP